jgi:hypothetical protein
MGLMENHARAFSRSEEQALKWATIYQEPTHFTARRLRNEPGSKRQLRAQIAMQRKARLVTSATILRAVFTPVKAAEAFELFASNYINDAFDRLANMTEDNVVILTK